jgi:uncharacterized protein YcbX
MHVSALHTYPVKGCRRLDHDSIRVEPWGLAGDRRWLITDPDGQFISQRQEARLALIHADPDPAGLVLSAPGVDPIEVAQPLGDDLMSVQVWLSTIDAAPAAKSAAVWLSEYLDRDVRLVWLDDPTRRTVNPAFGEPADRVSFADGYPVLLASESSLAQLNDWVAEDFPDDAALLGPLPMTRFRPNVVLSGAPAWWEDQLTARRVRIGSTVFRVPKPCGRCVVTTIDQESAERTRQPLRTLARRRLVDQDLLFGTNLIPDSPQPTAQISIGDQVELI